MIAAQRRNRIKELLLRDTSVKVTDLVRVFQVSEETIRRDLIELEREGIVKKNYGGAILVEELRQAMANITPVNQRKFQLFEEKDAIGRKAVELVESNQVVMLDAGSTTWCVARHLRNISNLTVVTNGINVAEEVAQNEDTAVFVVGGKLNTRFMSLVGPQPEVEIQKYNADVVFLGTTGVSLTKGFTSSDIYEAEVKRAMANAGSRVVVVADHSKLEKSGLISFMQFREVDVLVTSSLANPDTLLQITQQGVEVVVCDLSSENKAV